MVRARQGHGHRRRDTRISFIGGGASARYQIPNNINQVSNFTVLGNSTWDSSILDQRQWETRSTYFGIASLQKTYQDINMQFSGFARYSQLNYQPDAIGDLLYNGFAPWAQRTSFATGVQGDAAGRWRPGTHCAAASSSSASASRASRRPIPCRWFPTRPIRMRPPFRATSRSA